MTAKKILTVLTAGLLMTQSILATDFTPIKETSKINSFNEGLKPVKQELIFYPLSFIVSGLELGTEFKVKDNNTLRLSAGYFMSENALMYENSSTDIRRFDANKMEGFRTEAQYRFYSRDYSAPDNFFLGVYGVFKNVSLSGNLTVYDDLTGRYNEVDASFTSNALSLGTVLGYRTRFFDIFSMDFFIGGGITPINSGDFNETHVFQLPTKKSINFRLGWTLGIKI